MYHLSEDCPVLAWRHARDDEFRTSHAGGQRCSTAAAGEGLGLDTCIYSRYIWVPSSGRGIVKLRGDSAATVSWWSLDGDITSDIWTEEGRNHSFYSGYQPLFIGYLGENKNLKFGSILYFPPYELKTTRANIHQNLSCSLIISSVSSISYDRSSISIA